MANYQALLESDIFTFFCGTEGKPLKIHAGVFQGLSEPLEKMTSNGMRESVECKAILEDVDPQTFTHFAEYAYTGIYRAPAKTGLDAPIQKKKPAIDARVNSYCSECHSPYAKYECRWKFCGYHQSAVVDEKGCVYCGIGFKDSNRCENPSCQPPPKPEPFLERMYPVGPISHKDMRDQLSLQTPEDLTTDRVTCHARLYIFAQQFMIDGLKQLCLHKLYRDLLHLKLNEATVSEVVELITYAYDNTSGDTQIDDNQIEDGIGKNLRDLVVAYAVWKADELTQYKSFKSMVGHGGDHVTDIFCMVLKRAAENKA